MVHRHYLGLIIRDILKKKNNDKNDKNDKLHVNDTKNELSPETMKRNKSNDNFMKFQWPWLF